MGELLNVLRRLRIAGVMFTAVLVVGTIGYHQIGGENTTFLDAFYMTGITISTIGYHEVIPLTGHPYGRLFTVFLAFSGFGVLTYFLSNLIALFIEGDVRKTIKRRNMINKIKKLHDHYIIVGCGRVGRNVAKELYSTQRLFVLSDLKEGILQEFSVEIPGTPYVSGDCTEEFFLESLGIRESKGLFVVTGDDNINLVICLTARQINPRIKIVSVCKKIDHQRKIERAGANRVITPNFIGGLRMASEMLSPTVTNFLDLMQRSEFNQRIEEIVIPNRFDNTQLGKFPTSDLPDTLILALRSGEKWIYNPKKDQILMEGNSLMVMTTPKDRKYLEKNV